MTTSAVPVARRPVAAEPRQLAQFGSLLRSLREGRGLSQAALARQVHVHRDLIAKIERAVRWPSEDLAIRCDALLQTAGELHHLWPSVDAERKQRHLSAAAARITERLRQDGHLEATSGGPALTLATCRPESRLLGQESVVIVTPLKKEAIRDRPVVAVEDVVGAQRLGAAAQALGLTPTFETVPLGGRIDLNRANLVIICGPRLSQTIGAVLDTDPNLRFVRAPDGPWTLKDLNTGKVYRSGLDQEPAMPNDVAYLGRTRRPDGAGALLIFTGIHPQGSLGVVRLLCNELPNLHEQVGDHAFSVLVATEYDPNSGEPRHVQFLTPVYRRDEIIS
jgi:transcriptional regulator with XRE-family HTH domain